MHKTGPSLSAHIRVLDGWRGLSILAVLACHNLPLGPNAWSLNITAGLTGMALFFCLSGFLITRFLLTHDSVVDFLIRRLCRIVPLAWLVLPLALLIGHAQPGQWLPHFLFFANIEPLSVVRVVDHVEVPTHYWETDATDHYWSLCVEVQFYALAALLFGWFGRRSLKLLPPLCLAITGLRVLCGVHLGGETYWRVDEILSGATLALIVSGEVSFLPRSLLAWVNPWVILVLFVTSCNPWSGPLNYARPYLAAALIGSSLQRAGFPFLAVLQGRVLRYLADISYALYIVHPVILATWLGDGPTKVVKYLKRPLVILLSFLLAHLSTRYYERFWIDLGRRWAGRLAQKAAPAGGAASPAALAPPAELVLPSGEGR